MGSRKSILAGRARQPSTTSRKLCSCSSDLALKAQFRVMWRMRLALCSSRTGEQVSVRMGNVTRATARQATAVALKMQRQPRLPLEAMADPTMGPMTGPTMRKVPAHGMAKPRCFGVHMSAMVPLMMAEGAAPKNPWRKRETKTMARVLLAAPAGS